MKKYIAGAVVGVAVTMGAAAYASIPDSSGVITGCVKKDSVLRVIDTNDTNAKERVCKKDELKVTWNQTGPRGAQGLQGIQGPPGLSLFANVRADGTLASGGGVATSAKFVPDAFGSGYVVTFTQNVALCAAVASAGQTGAGTAQSDAIANSNVDTLGTDKVYVQFTSTTGLPIDTDFHLILAC